MEISKYMSIYRRCYAREGIIGRIAAFICISFGCVDDKGHLETANGKKADDKGYL